jgi:hypothetical protein
MHDDELQAHKKTQEKLIECCESRVDTVDKWQRVVKFVAASPYLTDVEFGNSSDFVRWCQLALKEGGLDAEEDEMLDDYLAQKPDHHSGGEE